MIEKNIYFRFADENDCKLLFDWRNDEGVRKKSGDTSELKYDSHKTWFLNALNNSDIIIFIMLNEKYQEIGQVRLNISNKENVISISLDKEFRGKGYGTLAIKKSSELFINKFKTGQIIAKIKKDNIPSIKSFEKAGYVFYKSLEDFNNYIYTK
jgi:RimJ/RimL family protein N-acetyltransferase